jgi:peptidyl-prolyl cis-trans isomerase A (cyclophilin A)
VKLLARIPRSTLGTAALVTLSAALVGAAPPPAPVDVAIVTTLGTIVVHLDRARAPLTTANFLRYVDDRTYDGATFYRSVPRRPRGRGRVTIAVIQGGLETKLGDSAVNRLPTIRLEATTTTGLSNTDGTLAMARDTAPNTASSEFFINIGDDTVLDAQRFRDHHGYAVFGRVIEGMSVVRAIARSHAKPDPVMTALLAPPIRIVRVRRVERP